jgi:hypothetical protein
VSPTELALAVQSPLLRGYCSHSKRAFLWVSEAPAPEKSNPFSRSAEPWAAELAEPTSLF